MSKNKKGRTVLILMIILLLLILMGIVQKNSRPQGDGEAPPMILAPIKLFG